MKINPACYNNLLGKKYLFATLILEDPKNPARRVANLKDAELGIEIKEVTKIVVKENKADWVEKAFTAEDEAIFTAYTEGGLAERAEEFAELIADYTFPDERSEYYNYAPDAADLRKEYLGETPEQIRELLEATVKAACIKSIKEKEDDIKALEAEIVELKRFMA